MYASEYIIFYVKINPDQSGDRFGLELMLIEHYIVFLNIMS